MLKSVHFGELKVRQTFTSYRSIQHIICNMENGIVQLYTDLLVGFTQVPLLAQNTVGSSTPKSLHCFTATGNS